MPFVGTYTILISAPGQEPTFLTGIRPDRDMPLKIELNPGDGRKITQEDLKKFQTAKGAAPAAGGGAAGAAAAKQPSAAELKKQQEEYEKAKASNEKAKADFENMKKLFESGVAKKDAKDWSGAIADFNEASRLDADQYAVWANLALVLYNRIRGITSAPSVR